MTEREQMRQYLLRWKELGPILENLRDEETRQADTPAAIRMLSGAFQIALRDLPPRESSGLVEWHRLTHRWQLHG